MTDESRNYSMRKKTNSAIVDANDDEDDFFTMNKKRRSKLDEKDEKRDSKRERKSLSDKAFERQMQLAIEKSKKEAESACGSLEQQKNDILSETTTLEVSSKEHQDKNLIDETLPKDEMKKLIAKSRSKKDNNDDAAEFNCSDDDDDFIQDKKKSTKKKTHKLIEKQTTPTIDKKQIKNVVEPLEVPSKIEKAYETKNEKHNELLKTDTERLALSVNNENKELVVEKVLEKVKKPNIEVKGKKIKLDSDDDEDENAIQEPNKSIRLKEKQAPPMKQQKQSEKSSQESKSNESSFAKPPNKVLKSTIQTTNIQNSSSPLGRIQIQSPGVHRVGLSRNSRLKPLHPNVKPNM